MAARRRRRRPNGSDGSAAITVHQAEIAPIIEASGTSILVGRWLITLSTAMLLGAVLCTVVMPILKARSVAQDSFDEGLLVTQQLDALFSVVQSQLQDDVSDLASHRELLDTFLAYDRLYVEQASIDPAARLAKAFAARRMGHCYQAIGELEDSVQCYRQSRELFASCWQADPEVIDLYSFWLNAHTQIIYAELARGDLRSANIEYRRALRVLKESKLVQDLDYHKSLMLELKLLAQLGIELKLYTEARQVAERFAVSAKTLSARTPQDSELAQDAADADQYLQVLSSLVHQRENQ